ncbi:MAG TPA: YlbF family regulator [Clostridiales bacterium]|nr:YlbF family regulator [Clostridiales bacterium]
MDIIEKTRELGKMLQEDERYKAYFAAKEMNDKDEDLQALIGEFNLKRVDLNMEMSKDEKNTEKLKDLDTEIKELYGKIMANPNMLAFNDAKNAMDDILSQINNIITMSANGEDPETCGEESSCGGSCSSCSGCH